MRHGSKPEGEIIVAEKGKHCISIFSPTGEKLRSFGSKGSGQGQFNYPYGVAVDDVGDILVADVSNYRILKVTINGNFITAMGKGGNKPLELAFPINITFHPKSKKLYIVDNGNHCIQILNPDLTFSGSFGSRGNSNGQFNCPHAGFSI